MATNYFRVKKGVTLDPQAGSTVTKEGDIAFRDDIKKFEGHDGTTADNLVEEAKSATLTNKNLSDTTTLVVNAADSSKQLKFNVAGMPTASQSVLSFPINAQTLTFPDVTSSILARTSSDINGNRIQNKDLDASNVTICDPTTTSKKIGFSASGATASTTTTLAAVSTVSRTLTLPDLTDNLVSRTSTDTLTNKSVDAATNTITNIANANVSGTAAIAYSKLNLATSIVNADISAGAAIAYSKLALASSVKSTDLTSGVAANGTVATANGSGGVSYLSVGGGTKTVVSKTANYTISTSDDVVLGSASGGAFTLTLPDATTSSGKYYWIKRTDNTVANTITLATTSAQTIDGATTVKLTTQYEQFQLVSDGANWQITDHITDSIWSLNAISLTYTGCGTVSAINILSRREGSMLHLKGHFQLGSVGSAVAKITLPSGYAIDTSQTSPGTQQGWVGTFMQMASASVSIFGSTSPAGLIVNDGTSTTDLFFSATISGGLYVEPAANAQFNSNQAMQIDALIPITGWSA